MPESRQVQVFRSRCEYLEQHIQVVDAALNLVTDAIDAGVSALPTNKRTGATLAEALNFDTTDYPRLQKLPARQWDRTLHTHSERRNYEFALGELYAYFDEYVRSIVEGLPISAARYPAAAADSVELKADRVKMLLRGNLDLDRAVGESIMQKIRAKRFGKGMAEELCRLFELDLDHRLQHYAHFVLDVRNALIHHSGRVSKSLVKEYGKLLKTELDVEVEKSLKLNFEFVSAAVLGIKTYMAHLDGMLLNKGYLVPHNVTPRIHQRH